MGIKWKDVKVGVSPITNAIYLGKIRKTSGIDLWTDKSEDKTNEIILCVMEHMLNMMDKNGNTKYKSGKTTLTISVDEQ